MRKLILDCDPGVDDATALFLAFAARNEIDLLGVTTVAGNVGIEKTTRNACAIRGIAGREDVPVFAGCAQPLAVRHEKAEEFHGADGLGDLRVSPPQKGSEDLHAVSFIVETLRAAPPRSVTIAITGPCTNLAAAFAMKPECARSIEEVVIMGGARSEGGNITASAEYNIYADPHAAAAVIDTPVKKTIFGLDCTHQVRHTESDIEGFRALGTRAGDTVADLFAFSNKMEIRWNGLPHAPLHDPCTVAYLLRPDLFQFRDCRIAVETQGALTMGHTQIEFRKDYRGPFNARWAVRADPDGVLALIRNKVSTL
jgi:purine nucleosidase